jgi:integrase
MRHLVFSSTGETPPSGFSRAKKRADRRLEEEAALGGLPPMKPWTLHDLRRTMVTMMNEELGIPPHVVEAVVNHIGPAKQGVAGVYNRALYLEERARALQSWADLVSLPAAR